ncbi:hypothetical protein JCM10914A_22300 [Paenibacillus sp. JCM 10914]
MLEDFILLLYDVDKYYCRKDYGEKGKWFQGPNDFFAILLLVPFVKMDNLD